MRWKLFFHFWGFGFSVDLELNKRVKQNCPQICEIAHLCGILTFAKTSQNIFAMFFNISIDNKQSKHTVCVVHNFQILSDLILLSCIVQYCVLITRGLCLLYAIFISNNVIKWLNRFCLHVEVNTQCRLKEQHYKLKLSKSVWKHKFIVYISPCNGNL